MERCEKRQSLIPASMLNLAHWGFPKCLRRWFWKNYLDELDQAMVWSAHKNIEKFATKGRGREFMEEACKKGYLNLFIWMRGERTYPNWEWRFWDVAACNGHLEILKWIKETQGLEPGFDTFLNAARGRHFHILEWTVQLRYSWTKGYILYGYNISKSSIIEPELLDWINKHIQ